MNVEYDPIKKAWLVLFLIGIGFTLFSCQENTDQVSTNVNADSTHVNLDSNHLVSTFPNLVKDYPKIKDTVAFITELLEAFQLELEFTDFNTNDQRITAYDKVELKDATQSLFLIEYSFPEGATVLSPWKYQCFLTENGEPLKVLRAQRFEYLQINANENPYLLTLTTTGHGNGDHQVYRMKNDALENVLGGFQDYFPRTYDSHGVLVNEPNEFELSIIDDNDDGFNDIVFKGFIRNASESTTVNFIFLYHQETQFFIEKENYYDKYLYLDSLSY